MKPSIDSYSLMNYVTSLAYEKIRIELRGLECRNANLVGNMATREDLIKSL